MQSNTQTYEEAVYPNPVIEKQVAAQEKDQAIAAARIILMRDGTLKEKMACAKAVRTKRKMQKRAENKTNRRG